MKVKSTGRVFVSSAGISNARADGLNLGVRGLAVSLAALSIIIMVASAGIGQAASARDTGADTVAQAKENPGRNSLYSDGKKALRSGNYEKAAKLFREIISSDSLDLQAHIGLAYAYFKDQNYQLCFNHSQEAIKINPNNARAYALSGVAMLRSGFIEEAVQALVRANKLDPKEALAFGGAAEIDYYEGRAKEARLKAIQAYSLDPSEADYLMTLGRAASRLELFTEAADAYERFLQVAPRTDNERRDRIKGLIQFYRQLIGVDVHQLTGLSFADVPFLLGADRRPYIRVRVNGREATFVIDTGSGFTVISKDAAKRFGVSPLARGGTSQGIGGDGTFDIVYGLINSIQLGDVKVKSIPCFIRPLHGTEDHVVEERADGFIGLSVLAHFLTELDYKEKVMRLDRRPEKVAQYQPPPDGTVIAFRTTQNGLISIETELDGNHRINAILDSGASSSVVSAAAVERLNLQGSIIRGQTARVVGAAGVTDNVEMLYIRNCRVADIQQNNMRALILDFDAINETSGFEQSGILGGDFLRNFRVTIDFTRGQVIFTPHSAAIIKQ
ncbi:MAG TPA: aspartyl protease family protein [Blastocatellia bacterium]|nr:aspartyl protease family protein [Blastocatellia bacterium]